LLSQSISPDTPELGGIIQIFGIAGSENYISPLDSGQADVSNQPCKFVEQNPFFFLVAFWYRGLYFS
jgi:hypothetical protein